MNSVLDLVRSHCEMKLANGLSLLSVEAACCRFINLETIPYSFIFGVTNIMIHGESLDPFYSVTLTSHHSDAMFLARVVMPTARGGEDLPELADGCDDEAGERAVAGGVAATSIVLLEGVLGALDAVAS